MTVCTKDKSGSLGSVVDGKIMLSPAATIAEREMSSIASHYSNVSIDVSVIMPNHVHAIVVIDGPHQYSPDSKSVGFQPGVSLATIVRG